MSAKFDVWTKKKWGVAAAANRVENVSLGFFYISFHIKKRPRANRNGKKRRPPLVTFLEWKWPFDPRALIPTKRRKVGGSRQRRQRRIVIVMCAAILSLDPRAFEWPGALHFSFSLSLFLICIREGSKFLPAPVNRQHLVVQTRLWRRQLICKGVLAQCNSLAQLPSQRRVEITYSVLFC